MFFDYVGEVVFELFHQLVIVMNSWDKAAEFNIAVADGLGDGDDCRVLFEELDEAFFFVLCEVVTL